MRLGFRPAMEGHSRIAMWSGPRNISTALMRSWENRSDAVVCDEPLYAHYLAETGLEHAMREEVIASQPTDWRDVARELTGPIPEGASVYYQKHMTHHLLDGVGREWLAELVNCFLIREPKGMLPSLEKNLRGINPAGRSHGGIMFDVGSGNPDTVPNLVACDDRTRKGIRPAK